MERQGFPFRVIVRSLLESGEESGGFWTPRADVVRTEEGWVAKLDLAGIDPTSVELRITGPTLTVRGTRRDSLASGCCEVHQMEIRYSRFERTLTFPCVLDTVSLRTEYQDGMFLVFLAPER